MVCEVVVASSCSHQPGDSLVVESLGSYCDVQFDDVYVLGDFLNRGSYGDVYEAQHISSKADDVYFAVKIIERSNDEIVEDVLHETQILKTLRNTPNVIKLIDFYMDEECMYIVQDLACGGDVLERLVQREHYTEHDARELSKILLTTIDSLHAHNIIHRDLKPENLLLKDNSSDAEILLCDFGWAKILPEPSVGSESRYCSSYCGTLAYRAPEIHVREQYNEKVDMWAIGCILFMLLGGYMPFGDDEDNREDLLDKIATGDYGGFEEDEIWDIVSGGAKNLIKHLFIVDPSKRWSASKALQCSWFTKAEATHLRSLNLSNSLDRLKKRAANRKLRAACDAVVVANRVSHHRHKTV